jgi:hypothetical protein
MSTVKDLREKRGMPIYLRQYALKNYLILSDLSKPVYLKTKFEFSLKIALNKYWI